MSTADSRREAYCMGRRDSSPGSSAQRRPRLLRISATEPSITTSNASRSALAHSHSPSRRATDILTRVAFASASPPKSLSRSASPISVRSPLYGSLNRHHHEHSDHSDTSSAASSPQAFDDPYPFSGRYFSFPSFDMYQAGQQQDEKGSIKSTSS